MALEIKKQPEISFTPQEIKEDAKKLAEAIAAALADKKAQDIVFLDMRNLTPATDWFVIASARSTTQARAIADNVEEKLDELGAHFLHKEGYNDATWILLDYGDAVCHIFVDDTREYYALERLWSDAVMTKYESV